MILARPILFGQSLAGSVSASGTRRTCWLSGHLGHLDGHGVTEEVRSRIFEPSLGLAGRKQEALTILEDLERRRSESYVGGSLLAGVCVGLGDHDRAITWLQKAAEERDGLMTFVNSLLVSDPLRSDPRFQALLQRMHFPAEA